MIKYSPVSFDKLPEPYCLDKSVSGYIGYDMNQDGKECGFSVFKLYGYTMEIIDVVSNSDDETKEGFIRSSLNYGANRGTYIAFYKAKNAIDVAKKLGFKENNNNVLEGEIPDLLAGHCGRCK